MIKHRFNQDHKCQLLPGNVSIILITEAMNSNNYWFNSGSRVGEVKSKAKGFRVDTLHCLKHCFNFSH